MRLSALRGFVMSSMAIFSNTLQMIEVKLAGWLLEGCILVLVAIRMITACFQL